MKRPAKSFNAIVAASLFFLLAIGIAGQAYGTPKPKFVYVTNPGPAASGDTIATYSVTATAVCGDSQCFQPIAISGTFTLDVTTGIVTGGTMYMTDAKDLASSPLAVPFSMYLASDFPNNAVVFFEIPGRTSAQSPTYVELIFPFSPFPASYSGGPLCTVAHKTNCVAIAGAEIGTANVNPSLYPTTLNGTNLASAEMTSGSVALTGTSGGSPGIGAVSGYAVDNTTGALTPVPGSPFAAGSGARSIAVDPSNRFVYVANANSNNVSAFAIDSTTGALTPVPGSPFAAGLDPYSVAVDPSGKFVYVANKTSNNVSAYTLDEVTGALTEISGSPFLSGLGPSIVTMDPLGRFVYVTNGSPETQESISEYAINKTTGGLNAVAGSPLENGSRAVNTPVATLVDPSGKFLYEYFEYESGAALSYAINSATGALTALGSPWTPPFPTTAAMDPSGRFLYAADSRDSFLDAYSLDGATGALTGISMPFTPTGNYPVSMAVDPSGQFVYLTNEKSNNISGYSIKSDTGALTAIPGSPFATGVGPTAVAIAGSSSTPFEKFEAKVYIDEDRKTSFHVEGLFRLSKGSVVDPVTQNVELQVGTYTVTIPAGSFEKRGEHRSDFDDHGDRDRHDFDQDRKRKEGEFEFEGDIDGVDLTVRIHQIKDNEYLFTAEGRGDILKGIKNPVTVGLMIGEYEGTTTVKADIDK